MIITVGAVTPIASSQYVLNDVRSNSVYLGTSFTSVNVFNVVGIRSAANGVSVDVLDNRIMPVTKGSPHAKMQSKARRKSIGEFMAISSLGLTVLGLPIGLIYPYHWTGAIFPAGLISMWITSRFLSQADA